MEVTAINVLSEVLVNVQTHTYLRLQVIISVQLHLTIDSPTADLTNTYLLILRFMHIGSTLY
jgi:hypothetical protein